MIKGVVNEVIWKSMDDFDAMVGMYLDDMTKVDVDVEEDLLSTTFWLELNQTAKLRLNGSMV